MAVATPPQTTADRGPAVPQLRGLDDYVRRLMREWKVPGISLTIARGGEVIYSRGYGLRDVAHDAPVTPHTIFPIGSTTKTFTTAALAILADEGLLDWDTPIREYLPTFKLRDQFASERMTPRDLTSHRSGLPRHDLMWYGSSRTRTELFDRLQYLEPNADFRTVWQYQNLMYMTAGHLVGVLSGTTWEDFVRSRILEPIGMVSTRVTSAGVEQAPDFSRGYRRKNNEAVEMPFYQEFEAVAPAGSIVSNGLDMGQWLLVHQQGGRAGDVQLLSEGQTSLLHTPQTFIARGKHPETPYSSYALGWFVEPYRGHDMIHHGGNIYGFSSMCALMPGDDIGVMILTNMDATPVRNILTYNVFDRFIGGKQVAWNARARSDRKEMEAAGKRGKSKRQGDRVQRTRPSHPLEDYAGTYTHPAYGDLRMELDGKRLRAMYNGNELSMRHYHYDTFELTLDRFDMTFLGSFAIDKRGQVASLSLPLEPSVPDIVFDRVPDAAMTDPAFLQPFAGAYDLMGSLVTVELKGDRLFITVPGRPEYELAPLTETEFAFKGLSGLTIEFKRDDAGAATEALINQMGAVFVAPRR